MTLAGQSGLGRIADYRVGPLALRAAEGLSGLARLVTGTFARRAERSAFGQSHPLNLLWQAFTDEVASGLPYSL